MKSILPSFPSSILQAHPEAAATARPLSISNHIKNDEPTKGQSVARIRNIEENDQDVDSRVSFLSLITVLQFVGGSSERIDFDTTNPVIEQIFSRSTS
jgi:hypothetical protein